MRGAFISLLLLALLAGTAGCGREMALGGPVAGPVVRNDTFFKAMTQAGYAPHVFEGTAVTSSIGALRKAHVNTLAIQAG